MNENNALRWWRKNCMSPGEPVLDKDGDLITLLPDSAVDYFTVVREAPAVILTLLGFGLWNEEKGVFGFPHQWYNAIPEGAIVYDIDGDQFSFYKEYQPLDFGKHGLLNYGVRRKIV